MMRSHVLSPSPTLAPYVDFYIDLYQGGSNLALHRFDRIDQTDQTESTLGSHRIFPAPATSIAFGYGGGRASMQIGDLPPELCCKASYSGYATGPKRYLWHQAGGVFVVVFKAWGLSRFTSFPLQEGENTMLDLTHLFGNEADRYADQVQEAANVAERKEVVEHFLLSILSKRDRFSPGVDDRFILQVTNQMVASAGGLRVAAMADECGISRKQFDRRFLREVGMAPKLFNRLVRFQYAIGLLQGSMRTVEVAYESGFFDQAHFNRDFRALSGITPGQFYSSIVPTPVAEQLRRTEKGMSHLYNRLYE